jgi:glycerol kinase
MLGIPVRIPDSEELSGIGAAWAAGLACGLYREDVFNVLKRTAYAPEMAQAVRDEKYALWQDAVRRVRT